jgi:hypothetical protein
MTIFAPAQVSPYNDPKTVSAILDKQKRLFAVSRAIIKVEPDR